MRRAIALVLGVLFWTTQASAQTDAQRFQPQDVFALEWAADPQISPDGQRIVYTRNFMDAGKDRRRSNLWIINFDGADERPLTTGLVNDGSPRWSPDGKRIVYVSTVDGTTQLYARWIDTGEIARLTQLQRSPSGLAWSPDGRWIAFTMLVPESTSPLAALPPKPDGATWAEPVRVIDALQYRADGAGYLERGHVQLFVLPAQGGTPRQLTRGAFDHSGAPSWSRDGKSIVLSANRHEDAPHQPINTEVYSISVADGSVTALTSRNGPDDSAVVSPDGLRIAFVGFDDRYQGYQVSRLYLMDRDGGNRRALTERLDRDVVEPVWSADGRGLYFQYDDQGDTRVAFVDLGGTVKNIAEHLGGNSIDRPYGGGAFTVSANGRVAFTVTRPDRLADIAVGMVGQTSVRTITAVNEDLLAHKQLGPVEELWYNSSKDNRRIQGWIVKPPGFNPAVKYPLILEIHGGPFANYGPRFAADYQLYAARGYVVLYTNPRGSTSYGEEFGNLIHHAYPGDDYDDLMSGVDAVIAKGYVDTGNLFITGGSGGGVLSSWSIGKTDRFRAAVVQKPVINWYSFVLTADAYPFFVKYWFSKPPWEDPQQYLQRSPISLVGNVKTPTMLITGESDYRTPISESEQYYQALQLRKIESVLVRIPGASHSIDARPSNLIAKAAHVIAWFDKHRTSASKPVSDRE